MLRILKETSIFSLSEYLENMNNEADVQGVIADVIDSEDMLELLMEIIVSSNLSDSVGSQFAVCFKQYVADLMDRPELIAWEFISHVEPHLSSKNFRDSIVVRFVDELLANNRHDVAGLTQVISEQHSWNNQYSGEEFKVLTGILRQISINHSDSIIKEVLKQLQWNDCTNWFCLLLIIRFISQSSKAVADLKRKLRNIS